MPQIQVHQQTHNTARAVTIRHPNAFDAICFKKVYLTDNGENELGGFVVLGNEDQPDIDFTELGMAKVLFVDPWQASKIIADNINGNDARVKIIALIEPLQEHDFELDKGDLFYIQINDKLSLAYEIVGIELPIGLPTAMNAKRYLINKRDDLDYIANLPKGDSSSITPD